MKNISSWFYNTTLYYKFRHYFIRKKSPLSWIFWGEILRRESVSVGLYQASIAAVGQPDSAIALRRGAPGENNIEIYIYDSDQNHIETVIIPLSYRDSGRVMRGFDEANRISREQIRKENGRS